MISSRFSARADVFWALAGLAPRDIEEHSKALLAELQIEGLVHGNATKEVRDLFLLRGIAKLG